MYLDQGYAIPREIPDNCDFLSQFWPILPSRKYLCIDFTENFQNIHKNRGGELLPFPHHSVEITEFYCHNFFANFPSNQHFTKGLYCKSI